MSRRLKHWWLRLAKYLNQRWVMSEIPASGMISPSIAATKAAVGLLPDIGNMRHAISLSCD